MQASAPGWQIIHTRPNCSVSSSIEGCRCSRISRTSVRSQSVSDIEDATDLSYDGRQASPYSAEQSTGCTRQPMG